MPRPSRWQHCSPRGRPPPLHRAGHRPRHLLQTATSFSTTRRQACAAPIQTPGRDGGPSSSRTAHCRSLPVSASSTATAQSPDGLVALGGPVRRLRQRSPGDHRQLHRLGGGEVGADPRASRCCCSTGTKAAVSSTERADRAVHPARGRGQHPHRQPLPPRPSISTCCGARPTSQRPGRWWSSPPRSYSRCRGHLHARGATSGSFHFIPGRPARLGP